LIRIYVWKLARTTELSNFKIRRLQHWMLLATGKIQLVVVVWLQF
jgi:hypothetical protein